MQNYHDIHYHIMLFIFLKVVKVQMHLQQDRVLEIQLLPLLKILSFRQITWIQIIQFNNHCRKAPVYHSVLIKHQVLGQLNRMMLGVIPSFRFKSREIKQWFEKQL